MCVSSIGKVAPARPGCWGADELAAVKANHLLADVQHTLLDVDILPAQAEEFATAQPRSSAST
jgi:hypothetical protein